MTDKRRERRIGMLEMACALAAPATVLASRVREMNANLFMVLIMLVAAYAVLRDLPVLWLSKATRSEGPDTSESSAPVHQQTPSGAHPRTISLLRE